MNDIQITVENVRRGTDNDDWDWDTFDPMKEEYDDVRINSYDHGPGANLDVNLQRPAYRGANNEAVFKIMINRIPSGLTKTGLENLLINFGVPNVSKAGHIDGRLIWALVEFKTLKEALNTIHGLDSIPPYRMKVSFAKSDEENERIRKEKEESERIYREILQQSSTFQQQESVKNQNTNTSTTNRLYMRALGRGHRGKFVINAYRQNRERQLGLKNCSWSNGIPDFRDPGGLLYDPKSNKHDSSNKYIQSIVVTTGSNSIRKVTMGRGYVPPEGQACHLPSQLVPQKSIGSDVNVPLLPCRMCHSPTTQKCSRCGTNYCSRKCQKEDFRRHRPECIQIETIDYKVDEKAEQALRFVPLSEPINNQPRPQQSASTQENHLQCGRPDRSVVGVLGEGTKAIVSVSSQEPGKYHGALSCAEMFEVSNKLLAIGSRLQQRPDDYWPIPGSSVAVNFDGSSWRGYILNTPIIGDSNIFTVALCDYAKIEKVAITDIFPLSSDYYNLPEMSVTCEVLEPAGFQAPVDDQGHINLDLIVASSSGSHVTAKVKNDSHEVIAVVSVRPWQPLIDTRLTPVQITPPCPVIITAFHHQHALYVRPVGQEFQEQIFKIMQRVAAVAVTSPPLNRAPYKDEMVACRYKNDGNYYRALVHDAVSETEYSVFFVDFGNLGSAFVQDMKALSWELKKMPCMAVKVGLRGVSHGPLTDIAVRFLNMMVQKELQLQLECPNHTPDGVELFLPDKRSFNTELQNHLLPEWKSALNDGDTPHRGEVFMLENFKVLPLIQGGLKSGFIDVFMMHIMKDGRIAVCPVDRQEVEHVMETLTFQINEYCESTDQNSSYNPRENEVCLVKYKDGMWHRAVNMRTLTESQSCQVLFLDFGNVEDVQFQNIRRMVPDFVTSPTIVSMCHLDGVPDEPTVEMIQRIHQVLPVNKVLKVEVLDMTGEGEYKIAIPEISNQLKSEFSC